MTSSLKQGRIVNATIKKQMHCRKGCWLKSHYYKAVNKSEKKYSCCDRQNSLTRLLLWLFTHILITLRLLVLIFVGDQSKGVVAGRLLYAGVTVWQVNDGRHGHRGSHLTLSGLSSPQGYQCQLAWVELDFIPGTKWRPALYLTYKRDGWCKSSHQVNK